jgi:predicted metal-dependent peptidase
MSSQETRLKKAHVSLMKHPETALYSGVVLMGTSTVVDQDITAYTDGINKRYGRKFITPLSDSDLNGLVLHENLHVALKHVGRFKREFKDNPMLMNASADYVVNDIIMNIKDKAHVTLPKGGLYDEKYHNWSVREVMNDLKKQMEDNPEQTQAKLSDGHMDDHDFEHGQTMSNEEVKKLSEDIDKAIREGGILAGRMGNKVPRSIQNLVAPKVDWREVLREFIMSSTRGNDEYTWRKFNKRHVANDLYLPSIYNETLGEVVIAIDTSGSIGTEELTDFASELVSVCDVAMPEKVRVLWWDTDVHGEQEFTDDYTNIAHLLKPQGGGGTDPQCIPKYIAKNNINAECVIVFTDGYFYSDNIAWDISSPTLWMVTRNEDLVVPSGQVVKQNRE